MLKDDLRQGMLVELRNGDRFFVVKHEADSQYNDLIVNIKTEYEKVVNSQIPLVYYNRDLTRSSENKELDIVKVGNPNFYPLFITTSVLDFSDVTWEREEILTERELMSLKKGTKIIGFYGDGVKTEAKAEFLAYIDDSMNLDVGVLGMSGECKKRTNRIVGLRKSGSIAVFKTCKLYK